MTISGFEGGTGASPITSLTHAGSPWEIGLAETHQTLCCNGLRGRIAVQVDGGLRTGRDVIIGALLGADEFGFATAPLISGRLHHDAQVSPEHLPGRGRDPETRNCASGSPVTPEHVINYFFFWRKNARVDGRMGFRTLRTR